MMRCSNARFPLRETEVSLLPARFKRQVDKHQLLCPNRNKASTLFLYATAGIYAAYL